MDSLENKLMDAVRDSKLDDVKVLLENGANVNYLKLKNKSPLATAASKGNVILMNLLLSQRGITKKCSDTNWKSDLDNKTYFDNCGNNVRGKHSFVEDKRNLGYFIVVHGEISDEKNGSLDAETPEGMERLEWDTEVEGAMEGREGANEDVWARQYRWYADILDKTGGLVEKGGSECEREVGCDIDLQDYRGRCALHYAVDHSHLSAVQCLLDAGCKVDIGDVDSVTPLHLAAMRNCVKIAELLIARGANVNRKTTDKMAALHYAAARGLEEMVDLLLRAGALVDPLDSSDRTPLLLAVTRDQLSVVRLLIDHGARVNMEEIHGYSPLCEAVWNKSVETVDLLLASGAKLTHAPLLLHYTVLHRHLDMASLLLKRGAYPNVRDDQGDTPLLLAVACAHPPMIQLLLDYEANPNFMNSVSGVTPLLEALRAPKTVFEEIVRLLCARGADLNQIGGGGTLMSPLGGALCGGHWAKAATLIRAGADVNRECTQRAEQEWRQSVLDMALPRAPTQLIYLIVTAGFDLTKYKMDFPKDFLIINVEAIEGWLTLMKFNPRRLVDLCRLQLRSQMGNNTFQIIPKLEIPQSLKRFLLFQDICVV